MLKAFLAEAKETLAASYALRKAAVEATAKGQSPPQKPKSLLELVGTF